MSSRTTRSEPLAHAPLEEGPPPGPPDKQVSGRRRRRVGLWARAYWSGTVAGAAMALIFGFGRAYGVHFNVSALWGSVPSGWTGPGAWSAGLLAHLFVCGLIGILYARALNRRHRPADARTGVFYGLAHAGVSGVLLDALPAIHPLFPVPLSPPGAFLGAYGLPGVMTWLLAHIVFGTIVVWACRTSASHQGYATVP